MKLRTFFPFVILFLIALCAPARAGTAGLAELLAHQGNSGSISAAQVGTWPNLTPGSFVAASGFWNSPGIAQITVTGSGTSATLAVYDSPDGVTHPQIPNSSIWGMEARAYGAIASGVTATYFVFVPAGTVDVEATSYSSGPIAVTIKPGPTMPFFPGQNPVPGDQAYIFTLTGSQSANAVLGTFPLAGMASYSIYASSIGTSITSVISRLSNDGSTYGANNNLGVFSSTSSAPSVTSVAAGQFAVFPGSAASAEILLNGTQSAGTTTVMVVVKPQTYAGLFSYTSTLASTMGGYSYTNVVGAAAGTSIKSGAGTLHIIVINTKGSSSTLTLYDGTSTAGTKIGTIDLTGGTNSLPEDIAFSTGLFVVVTGTLSDLTFSWK